MVLCLFVVGCLSRSRLFVSNVSERHILCTARFHLKVRSFKCSNSATFVFGTVTQSMARARANRHTLVTHADWETIMDDRFLLCSPTEGISTYNRFLQTEREAKRQRSDQYRDYPEHRDVIMVAEGLRKWAFEGSWAVCAVCRGAHRAKLDPTHFLKDHGEAVWDAVQRGLSIQDKWPNIMKTCSFCAGDYICATVHRLLGVVSWDHG